MGHMINILKEQIQYMSLIVNMAKYENKSKYQMHYLGIVWQFLVPLIQVAVYWFIFGVGIRSRANIDDVPFFIWLIAGIVPWFFINASIVQGANSVYAKVNLVSKMKFPISVLPTVSVMSNAFNFIVMLFFAQIVMIFRGIYPTLYTLQLAYYVVATVAMVFSFALLFSTLSTIVRDFQNILQSVMRLFFFLSPILWDPSRLSPILHNMLKLSPFYYLINGFRDSFLGYGWVWHSKTYMLYFWVLVTTVFIIGSYLHMKFKDKFIDYV